MMIRRRDRGSAGVWLLGLCSVLVLAATAAVLVGSALVTRHKAIAAADLSALAAAGAALEGEESACAAAADIATSMGARLLSCSLGGVIADVTVSVSAELGVVGLATARASARAGPVDYADAFLGSSVRAAYADGLEGAPGPREVASRGPPLRQPRCSRASERERQSDHRGYPFR
ncbi:MAG: flp pilus-assembly TadE/G-like family protein [Geodermatophilaceae bacterium]|nr:flp pilus-assembly TadE/G-like family protein [Geodermatophilaceae bacterium]